MNLMLAIWICLLFATVFMSVRRPAWGAAAYMLTYFASPSFWWWGGPLAGYRMNYYGGLLLFGVVLIHLARKKDVRSATNPGIKRTYRLGFLIFLNATLVHYLLAANADYSFEVYLQLGKFLLLFLLLSLAIQTRSDLSIVLIAIVLGCAYTGYEATINERGNFIRGRLENIGPPGASQSNELSAVLAATLPLVAVFFLAGTKWQKIVATLSAPFMLNLLILCNSRGGFLAAIGSGIAFVVLAPKKIRRQSLITIGLGAFAAFMLLGNERIVKRFTTIFDPVEKQDASVSSRLDYWHAGIQVIRDYPLGSGGGGFSEVHGPMYIAEATGVVFNSRSVHNGYINDACEWGVQGLVIHLLFLGSGAVLLLRSRRYSTHEGWQFDMFAGISILAGIFAFLISGTFGDFLDNEWGYWLIALAVAHTRIVGNSVREELAWESERSKTNFSGASR